MLKVSLSISPLSTRSVVISITIGGEDLSKWNLHELEEAVHRFKLNPAALSYALGGVNSDSEDIDSHESIQENEDQDVQPSGNEILPSVDEVIACNEMILDKDLYESNNLDVAITG